MTTISKLLTNRRSVHCVILACLLGSSGQAEEISFRPMSLFSDHMVLQRDIPAPVWGTAAPGDTITAAFAGQRKTTKAADDGRWMVNLDPMAASSEPRELRIHSAKENRSVTLRDVLVGEVWVCAGQSNMEMPVGNAYRPDVYPGVTNFRQEIADARHPQIRMFLVEHQAAAQPMREVPTPGWNVCSPETVPRFSAVGYFFARHIHQQSKVPVGMVSPAWSATFAEAWCAPSGLRSIPKFRKLLEKSQSRLAAAKPPEIRREDPAALYHGMVAPLIPYAMRGVIWYQGENNAKSAKDYQVLFPALIRSWRQEWRMPNPVRVGAPGGDFPFLFVQLAAYGGKVKQPVQNGWADLREAQSMALSLPNTGMAVTIDIGDAKKIHPPNKQEVGRRLGLLARSIAYGETIASRGPVYQNMRVDGDRIRLTFDHAAGGLVAKNGVALNGFAIVGEDKKWQPAVAEIAGSEVLVSSPPTPRPVAVRYAWANNPDADLFNQAGLPAEPFRTDR